MYKQYLTLSFTGLLLQASGVLSYQLEPPSTPLQRRADGTVINPNPFPACNPKESENCIENGKYLLPPLPITSDADEGDAAYKKYLGTKEFVLSEWTNDLMPRECEMHLKNDGFDEADFTMYNVTFTDCTMPFVMCHSKNSPKTPSQIAVELSRVPITMRQSTSTFMVYGDKDTDNPDFKGFIGANCQNYIIVGRPHAFFINALVHEYGHALDCTLASPDAQPGGFGNTFSDTKTFQDAVDKDGFAVSHFATQAYVENYGDLTRLVLMDNIYPGGLKAFVGNHPNMTQIKNQLDVVKKSKGGKYLDYDKNDKCDLKVKLPYPTNLVQVKRAEKPTTPTDGANDGAEKGDGAANNDAAANNGGDAKPEKKDSAGAGRARPFAFFM